MSDRGDSKKAVSDENSFRIAGFDPGLARVGYAVIEVSPEVWSLKFIEYNTITTPAKTEIESRLGTIYEGVRDCIARNNPVFAGIEKIIFSKNTSTAMAVAQATGVIKLACYQSQCSVTEYSPLDVKKNIVGYGRATKEQIQSVLPHLLDLDSSAPTPDASDALAVAICCALQRKGTRILSGKCRRH